MSAEHSTEADSVASATRTSSATRFSSAFGRDERKRAISRWMCDTDLEMCGPPRTKRSLDVPGAIGREVVVAFAAALGGHGSGRRGGEGDGQGRQRERGDRRRGRSGVGGRRVRWRVLKREPDRRRGRGSKMEEWLFGHLPGRLSILMAVHASIKLSAAPCLRPPTPRARQRRRTRCRHSIRRGHRPDSR